MKVVCFYGPHFLGDAHPITHPEEDALLGKTDTDDNFCIPLPGLTTVLPVGSKVKFTTDEPDLKTIEFMVVEVFYVPDCHPDIVFLKLQLDHCDDVFVDELLAWLCKRNDTTQEYRYWG